MYIYLHNQHKHLSHFPLIIYIEIFTRFLQMTKRNGKKESNQVYLICNSVVLVYFYFFSFLFNFLILYIVLYPDGEIEVLETTNFISGIISFEWKIELSMDQNKSSHDLLTDLHQQCQVCCNSSALMLPLEKQ